MYYEYLISKVRTSDETALYLANHENLLMKLFKQPFIFTIPMDSNRYEDGISLRYRYEEDTGHLYSEEEPCNMLEMIVALAVRIENDFMGDEKGNTIGNWFVYMINSLGFPEDSLLTDEQFYYILNNFYTHSYSNDGSGGGCLFYIPGFKGDLRQMEIWNQMNCWIMYQKGENYGQFYI
ncbi:MAG: hypothetical protein J6U54_01745 [Clostridiales bacterium]|nr:hypothetical protein [Clostridiales bacterium]